MKGTVGNHSAFFQMKLARKVSEALGASAIGVLMVLLLLVMVPALLSKW